MKSLERSSDDLLVELKIHTLFLFIYFVNAFELNEALVESEFLDAKCKTHQSMYLDKMIWHWLKLTLLQREDGPGANAFADFIF